jgi:TetR/AcrR family fatty acid metabolism transcriptional regulator
VQVSDSTDATPLDDQLSPKHVQLIRSAYKVMGQQGVSNLNLQDVADDAGVSKATLFYYFESKENLILLTMRWVLARVARRIREAIASATSAHDKVLAMIDAIFIGPEANRVYYLIFIDLLSYAARVDRFGELSATYRTIMNGLYASIIESGLTDGEFRVADVAEAASVVRGIIDGLFLQWIEDKDWPERYAEQREICKRAILAYLH